MQKITFSSSDIEALEYERFHHPHPRVQRKMEVLWLKANGLQHKDICRLSGVSAPTMCGYFAEFLQGGIERIKEVKFRRQQSDLIKYKESLEAFFLANPPSTVSQAAQMIEERTGIKRGLTQTRRFLKKLGLKPRKVGTIPAKADVAAQEDFKKNP